MIVNQTKKPRVNRARKRTYTADSLQKAHVFILVFGGNMNLSRSFYSLILSCSLLTGLTGMGCGQKAIIGSGSLITGGPGNGTSGNDVCYLETPDTCDSSNECTCGQICMKSCANCKSRCQFPCKTNQECVEQTKNTHFKLPYCTGNPISTCGSIPF